MSSLDGLLVRKNAGTGQLLNLKTDQPVAIRIRHVGTAAVTSVTVTAATDIVLVDADGTTTSTFATDTTIGKVVDTINGAANWECFVLDALRSDASASRLLDGAISSGSKDGVTVWDVKVDTSTALQFAVCARADRGFSLPSERLLQAKVKIRLLKYGINMGTAAADSVKLIERKGATETTLLSDLSVDTTETTVFDSTAGGDESFIGGEVGKEYVFLVKDAATLADATTNYIRCLFKVE